MFLPCDILPRNLFRERQKKTHTHAACNPICLLCAVILNCGPVRSIDNCNTWLQSHCYFLSTKPIAVAVLWAPSVNEASAKLDSMKRNSILLSESKNRIPLTHTRLYYRMRAAAQQKSRRAARTGKKTTHQKPFVKIACAARVNFFSIVIFFSCPWCLIRDHDSKPFFFLPFSMVVLHLFSRHVSAAMPIVLCF